MPVEFHELVSALNMFLYALGQQNYSLNRKEIFDHTFCIPPSMMM